MSASVSLYVSPVVSTTSLCVEVVPFITCLSRISLASMKGRDLATLEERVKNFAAFFCFCRKLLSYIVCLVLYAPR